MKRTLRNVLVAVLGIVMMLSFMVGCGGPTPELKLNKAKHSMIVFDDYALTYELKNSEDVVTWSSSDSTVVSVTSNGVLTARKAGTATITASVKGASATCLVTVSGTDFVPELYVGEDATLNLLPNGEYTFTPKIIYKGQDETATYTYESNNTAVATVNANGKVTAVADGEAIITVTADFKGTTVTRTVAVEVKSSVSGVVTVGGETVGQTLNLEVEDEIDVQVSTLLNGVVDDSVSVSWSIVSGTTAITLSSTTAKTTQVTGLIAGTASIKLTLAKGSSTAERVIPVEISKKTVAMQDELLLGKVAEGSTYTINVPTEIDVEQVTLLRYGDVAKPVSNVNATNNTFDVDTSTFDSGENVTINIETDNYKYVFSKATVADLVIKSYADLATFSSHVTQKITENKLYVFGANVDWGNTKWDGGWNGSTCNFWGTIDGRGYTISGYQSHYGLFNINYGTIKNLNLKPQIKGSAVGGGVCLRNQGTIENCVIDATVMGGETAQAFTLVTKNNEGGTIKNCVAILRNYTIAGGTWGAGNKALNAISVDNSGIISNCYAVTLIASTSTHNLAYMYTNSVTTGLYANADAFFGAVTSLPSTDGWNSYWSINNGLFFNGTAVL